ncbi:hypothetical protein K439DRAFT_1569968 [Ramaria rubella]|nr:hypothetical protein K439DRAFT_1569968 [Ramaria rubella]
MGVGEHGGVIEEGHGGQQAARYYKYSETTTHCLSLCNGRLDLSLNSGQSIDHTTPLPDRCRPPAAGQGRPRFNWHPEGPTRDQWSEHDRCSLASTTFDADPRARDPSVHHADHAASAVCAAPPHPLRPAARVVMESGWIVPCNGERGLSWVLLVRFRRHCATTSPSPALAVTLLGTAQPPARAPLLLFCRKCIIYSALFFRLRCHTCRVFPRRRVLRLQFPRQRETSHTHRDTPSIPDQTWANPVPQLTAFDGMRNDAS